MYKKDDLVVLAANPYHIGVVRTHELHPQQQSYDIFEPIFEEISLWR